MAPKIKTSPHVFIVVSPTGVDSVHVTIESAQKRASAAKSEGSTNIKLEVHSIVGGRAQIDAEKPDDAAKAKPEVKAVEPLSQAAKLKEQFGDDATAAAPSPPPKEAQSEVKPAESKPTAAQQPDAKDNKPKESKAKESKPKEPKAKEPKTKEPKSESKAKEPKPKEIKPKEPKSESKAKETKSKEPKSDAKPEAKATDSKETATPSKPPPKTIPADEQRATNAKKGTKAADEDLPANVQALLSSSSDALDGLTIVVTGIPPVRQTSFRFHSIPSPFPQE